MDDTKLFWISANRYDDDFPPLEAALKDPDGLLAAGGNLTTERLLTAYRNGIFPWYSDLQPILWWSPDPRTVIYPDQIHISRSLKKFLKRKLFSISTDQAFENVIYNCAAPRIDQNGTWLTAEMIEAYICLYENGHAHSIECWEDDRLVGGLYGVAIGSIFFGESMFSHVDNASKVCLVTLAELLHQWQYTLIDCQVDSQHLRQMGAIQISRKEFKSQLNQYCPVSPSKLAWKQHEQD